MEKSDAQVIELYAQSFKTLHKNKKIVVVNAETGKIVYASTTFINACSENYNNKLVGKELESLPESTRKLIISENILSPFSGKVIGKIGSL